MRCHRFRALWLIPLLLTLTVNSSSAGLIFGKKNKKAATPAERVPKLLVQVKTDGDESKRAAAAQELRQFNPSQFPAIVPILADVLLSDKKSSVRAEAAQSLGKIRPISQQAGMALEQALKKDSSMRVRLQARSSLLQYHWSGYRALKKEEKGTKDTLTTQTKEPPLADADTPPPPTTTTSPQLPDGSQRTSSYPSSADAPAVFPPLPATPQMREPPLDLAPPSPSGGGNDNSPDLTPP